MKSNIAKVVRAAHRLASHGTDDVLALFVDQDDDVIDELDGSMLRDEGREALWEPATIEGDRRLVVLSAPRTGRELFRVLAFVERLVAPGGVILLLPFADEEGSDSRPEATEVFCGAYPEWSRRMIEAGVVELRKHHNADTEQKVFGSPFPLDRVVPSRAVDMAPRRKRVISLAVFGDCRTADAHWRQMPDFLACWVRAHHTLFAGYELRIQHDDWIYQTNLGDVLHGLQRRGLVKLVRMAPDGIAIGKCKSMLWRMAPVWDLEVSHVFCRDVDSIPTWRDRQACEEFTESGCAVGVVHDNPQHARMMGGLCAFDAAQFKKAVDKATFEQWLFDAAGPGAAPGEHPTVDAEARRWREHGADQTWLNTVVAVLKPTLLEHSLFETVGEGGVRQHRAEPTIAWADFRTSITMPAPAIVESVAKIVRDKSDGFTNYMGASGYRVKEALVFYREHCPVEAEIAEAESFGGEA